MCDNLRYVLRSLILTSASFAIFAPLASAQNQVLRLSAIGDYVAVPDSASLSPAGSFTIEGWMRVLGGTANPRLVGKGYGCGAGSVELEARNSTGTLTFDFPWRIAKESSGGPCDLVGVTPTPNNQSWVHLALVADATTGQIRLYRNGEFEIASAWAPNGWNGSELRIGRNTNACCDPDQLFGDIDNVRFWNVARTESELLCTANTVITAAMVSSYPGLVSVWNFEGTASDESGINPGSVQGAAVFAVSDDIPLLGTDCDSDGLMDSCEIAADLGLDLDGNGVLDECQVVGQPYCFGDGSAALCPCDPGQIGEAGSGCRNSAGTGGRLGATGSARITADSVVLRGSSLTPSTMALFFQATQMQGGGTGTAFGDGLLCANGSVIRLGVRQASLGVVRFGYHVGSDSPVGSAGLVGPAGGTRFYQVWYRDPVGFCTPAAFNLTNALRIDWLP